MSQKKFKLESLISKSARKKESHPLSLDELKSVAKRHKTFESFRLHSRSAYQSAKEQGILEEVCNHLVLPKNLSRVEVAQIATNYSTRTAFNLGDRRAYESARLGGYLDAVCLHMENGNKKKKIDKRVGKWCLLSASREASKYSSRTDFRKGSSGAYDWARRKGFLEDVCEHMSIPTTQSNHAHTSLGSLTNL